MKQKKIIFKKSAVVELNDTSLFTINGGTVTINETLYDPLKPKPTQSNTSISGPACTM